MPKHNGKGSKKGKDPATNKFRVKKELQDEEKLRMEELFDDYGDSYYEPIDENTLKKILENIDIKNCAALTISEKCEIDEQLREFGGHEDLDGLFRRVVAFSPNENCGSTHLALLSLRLYGGTVVTKLNEDVTHIIISENIKELDLRPSETKGRHLVTSDWIGKCIEEGKLLEETIYSLPSLINLVSVFCIKNNLI